MEIITNRAGESKRISFSVTPKGNFVKTIACGDTVIHKTTPDVRRFVQWMIEDESPRPWNACQLNVARLWWKLGGHFNYDHYKNVIVAKNALAK